MYIGAQDDDHAGRLAGNACPRTGTEAHQHDPSGSRASVTGTNMFTGTVSPATPAPRNFSPHSVQWRRTL
jgi:hypothetical protein